MKIILTNSFHKNIKKLWYSEESLLSDLSKNLKKNNFYILWHINDLEIWKWYIDSNKKRIVFLFKINNYLIPIKLLKKETKLWWNINKYNLLENFWKNIDKILKEIENKEIYKKYNIDY